MSGGEKSVGEYGHGRGERRGSKEENGGWSGVKREDEVREIGREKKWRHNVGAEEPNI